VGELDEKLWAVLSYRGCEAVDVTYDEAREVVRKLPDKKAYGICIVTAEAARRLTPETAPPAPENAA
jgi:vacuolar-type H+-ATPase subunit F/Vma7